MSQDDLDRRNASFWSEPCGTASATNLRLDLTQPDELNRYDEWYFNFYSYLKPYLKQVISKEDQTLEVGIGLGTVSRYLALNVKELDIVDIAPQAIDFTRNSMSESNNVNFFCESILKFEPRHQYNSIIAIGSLHHTGQLEEALKKLEGYLTPGGKILVMVYNAFHPRKILHSPVQTLLNFYKSSFSKNRVYVFPENNINLRKKADANSAGEAAPETVLSSRKFFLTRSDVIYNVELNNTHGFPFSDGRIGREFLLRNFTKFLGCDIYAIGIKAQ